MADTFASRFMMARAGPGPLVWGLDPSGALLKAWGLGDDPDGLDRFADVMLGAAAGTVGLVKPQSAFFERHGWRGVRTLSRLIAEARSAGLLVVLDVKRGDVSSTNDAYAEAFLGPGAPLEADAVTVHPYLGLAAMGAFVSRAHQAGSCLLVVTRSSNPEGRAVQSALGEGGRQVDEGLLGEIGKLNRMLAGREIGPVGAVAGPARIEPELDLTSAQALFLAPGVGAQGRLPRTWPGSSRPAPTGSCPARRGHCLLPARTSSPCKTGPPRWQPSSAGFSPTGQTPPHAPSERSSATPGRSSPRVCPQRTTRTLLTSQQGERCLLRQQIGSRLLSRGNRVPGQTRGRIGRTRIRAWSPCRRGLTTRSSSAEGLHVITYRATLTSPGKLVLFVAGLLLAERRRRGTPRGSRKLTCYWQAVLGLRWFRTAPRSTRWPGIMASRGPPATATWTR